MVELNIESRLLRLKCLGDIQKNCLFSLAEDIGSTPLMLDSSDLYYCLLMGCHFLLNLIRHQPAELSFYFFNGFSSVVTVGSECEVELSYELSIRVYRSIV